MRVLYVKEGCPVCKQILDYVIKYNIRNPPSKQITIKWGLDEIGKRILRKYGEVIFPTLIFDDYVIRIRKPINIYKILEVLD